MSLTYPSSTHLDPVPLTSISRSTDFENFSIFLDGSAESLNNTLDELDKFAKISGLKINYDKTQLVWIGSKKYSSDSIKTKWKLLWGGHTFKLLGINFNVDLEKMINDNYEIKLHHLEKTVTLWEKRSLTPLGKITVIKTFMMSAFNHLFIMLPNPDKTIIDKINNIMLSFLWNKKPSKIKQSIIVKEYGEGGLKMINLMAFIEALKSTWIRRLLKSDCKWQIFIKQYIQIEKLTGCGMNYIQEIITHIPNKFWKDVLLSFRHLNKQMILNDDDVLKSPLFYNENIKIDGTSIFFKPWFDKGVKYINDLVDDKGDFYTQADFSRKTGIKTNFLQYNGLIKAIKQYLKHIKLKQCFLRKTMSPQPFSN